SSRVRCSACGKVMTVEDDAAGEKLVCVACGTRLEAPPAPGADVPPSDVPGDAIAWDPREVSTTADGRVASATRLRRARPTDTISQSRKILLGVIGAGLGLIVIAVLLTAWIATGRNSRWSRGGAAENLRNNADLLALKSEAEALAIQG